MDFLTLWNNFLTVVVCILMLMVFYPTNE